MRAFGVATLVVALMGCVPEGDGADGADRGAADGRVGPADGGSDADGGGRVDAQPDVGAPPVDAGAAPDDASLAADGSIPMDVGGAADARAPVDATAHVDAAAPNDAGGPLDGAAPVDGGAPGVDGSEDDAAPADAAPANAPPTVRFLAPRAGATVTGPTTVRVEVSDDHDALGDGLAVTLTVDGVEIGALDAAGELAWTPAFRAGPRTLRALATDARGATSEAERAVTVDHPATLALQRCVADDCAPADGARLREPITLRPDWRDDDDAPTTLALRVDGTFVRAGLAPGEPFDFDPAGLDDGPHRLEVVGASGDDVGVSAAADVVVARCDFDGDGARAEACGGVDCDDDRPDVRPGADDPVGDGVDADCDGIDGDRCGAADCPEDVPLPGGGGPLSPGALITSFRLVTARAEAEALGCPDLGTRGARYGALVEGLTGRRDPARVDDAGHAPYRLAARMPGWQAGQPLRAVELPAIRVQAAFPGREGGVAVATFGVDGGWPQRFFGPLDGARFDGGGDAWTLPALLGPGLPGPALTAPRLTGALAVDGPDFSLTDGRLTGVVTDRALRDMAAEVYRVCREGAAPVDCGPVAGLLTGDRIADGQIVIGLLGGLDARLGPDGPEACPDPDDCDALTVCVAVEMAGAQLDPIERRPAGPCAHDGECALGECAPRQQSEVHDGVCIQLACGGHADCGPAGFCDVESGGFGLCWQACDADDACRDGWYCDARGACQPSCEAAFPCVPGFVCDPATRRCVDDAPVCAPACGPGTVCLPDDRCVSPDRRCVDDRGCPVGTTCDGGVCGGPLGGACEETIECPIDADCVLGECRGDCRVAGCPPDRICDPATGACVDGGGCDPACGPDATCLGDDRCVRDDRACADDLSCPIGTTCEDGRCAGPPGGACFDHLDCAADADCQGGVCTLPCVDDGDCALHLACRAGVCEAVACDANYDACAAGPGGWTGTCLHIADDGGLRCLEGGATPAGGACDPDLADRAAAADLCAPGSACFTAPLVSPDGRRGRCAPFCTPGEGDDCGAGQVCLDLAGDASAGPLAVCVSSDCEVFGGGCPPDARCRPWAIDARIGRCAPPGPVPDFGACDFDSDCASAAVCADPGAGPVCLPVCLEDADCPPGGSCYLDDGWAIGLCV
ncbi:MAG: Ig-like domain-containing protein [Myxococcales bacterium]|nr:Ig-like domain-containing protein [Myxococcales bacterium]